MGRSGQTFEQVEAAGMSAFKREAVGLGGRVQRLLGTARRALGGWS